MDKKDFRLIKSFLAGILIICLDIPAFTQAPPAINVIPENPSLTNYYAPNRYWICSGDNLSLQTSASGSIDWFRVGSSTPIGSGSTITVTDPGTYYYTSTNFPLQSDPIILGDLKSRPTGIITVDKPPDHPPYYCFPPVYLTLTMSPTPANSTIFWELPPYGSDPQFKRWYDHTTLVKVNLTDPNTYNLNGYLIESMCPNSVYYNIKIQDPFIAGTISSDQTICSGEIPDPFTELVPASGGTGSILPWWEMKPEGGSWVDANPPSSSSTYTYPNPLTQTTYFRRKAECSGGACPGETTYSNEIKITVVNQTIINTPADICSGKPVNFTPNTVPPSKEYSWSCVPINVSSCSSSSGLTIPDVLNLINTSIPGSVTYHITPFYEITPGHVCTGDVQDVVVNVFPLPEITVPPQEEICSGQETAEITPTSLVNPTTYSWVSINIPGLISFDPASGGPGPTIQPIKITNNTASDQTAQIQITPTGPPAMGSCEGAPILVEWIVHPAAMLLNTTLFQTVCSDVSTSTVPLTSNITPCTFDLQLIPWIPGNISYSGPASFSGVNEIPPLTFTNLTGSDQNVSITITPVPLVSQCPSIPATYTITVHPKVEPTLTGELNPCLNQHYTYTTEAGKWDYLWSCGLNCSIIPIPPDFNTCDAVWSAVGPNTISVTYNDLNGCSPASPTSLPVDVKPLPTPTITPDNLNPIVGNTVVYQTQVNQLNYSWTVSSNGNIIDGGSDWIKVIWIRQLNPSEVCVDYKDPSFNCTGHSCIEFPVPECPLDVNVVSVLASSNTAGSSFCKGEPGIIICVENAQSLMTYELWGPTSLGGSFGNTGQSFSGQTGTYCFPTPVIFAGVYKVKAINPGGPCDIFLTQTITVIELPLPEPDYNIGTACYGDPVTFTNTTSLNGGSAITDHLWDFGDGTTSTDQDVTHAFPTGSNLYNVTLTETNSDGCLNSITKPVTINPNPDIDFTFMATNVPYQVSYTAMVNPAQFVSNNIIWEFGDGSPSLQGTSVTHTFPGPGAFTVRATGTDMVTGCTNYVEHTVDAGGPPSAFFTPNPPDQCEGESISFIAGPPGKLITEEIWDYHDSGPTDHFFIGTQCCPANPTHVFTNTGPFHVTRTVNPGTNSQAIWDVYGTIYPNPGARFNWFSDPNQTWQGTACAGQEVYFRDASFSNSTPAGNIYKWFWDFGDPGSGPTNNTSNHQNPSHIFSTPGTTYNVTLIVWDNLNDCESSPITMQVTVNPEIATEFTYNDFTCIDQVINFVPEPSLVPADYTWAWDFGDGSPVLNTPGSVSHIFPAVGTWTVTLTLTDQFGCSRAKSHNVTVISLPIANFIFTAPSCDDNPIQFTDQSVTPGTSPDLIVAWDWNFGDGNTSTQQNPVYTYAAFNAAGYDVTLTVTTSRGCVASTTLHVQPIPGPRADFQVQPLTASCAIQVVQFNDLSQENGGGAIVSWLWDFDDLPSGVNNTSTAQNPSHTYTTAGPYNVKLTVKNGNGCSNTITIPITINDLPTADFTYTTACEGSQTVFTDISSTPAPSVFTTYQWLFGDGGSSNLQSPQHTYATYGSYDVTLTVTNSNGCTKTIIRQVTVSAKPVVEFTFSPSSCLGDPVDFVDHSYIPGNFSGHVDHWTWNYGDSSPLDRVDWPNNANVSHTFLGTATTHTVWLAVYTTSGCVDSISHLVTSIPSPVANFTYSATNCLGHVVDFYDLSSPNGGSSIQSWSWNFDDPLSGTTNTSSVPSPSHSFSTAANHHVTLTVANFNGCTNTFAYDIEINDLPIADFTYAQTCEGEPTQFTDASSTPAGTTINSYSWSFGDAGTSTSQSPSHIYPVAGLYNVVLTITNSNGCIKTISKPVIVNPKPVVEFSFTTSCLGNPVSYTDHSYIPAATGSATTILTWFWDYGDGTNSGTITFPNSPDVSHTFVGAAPFHIVRLTVTTTAGCTFFIEKTVTSIPSPQASFSYSTTNCELQPVQFNDLTQLNNGGNIQSWAWNFGDVPSGANNTSILQNPVHSFTAAGTYTVTLVVTNVNGCTSSYSIVPPITINSKPRANFTATNACLESQTSFTDASVPNSGTVTGWLWEFGDGVTTTAQNPTHIYGAAETYPVKLTVTTSNGCRHDTTKSVEVYGKPLPAFTATSPTCLSDSVDFVNQSTTPHGYVYRYAWDFGDGSPIVYRTFPNSANVSHKYATGGNYPVRLSITTSDSCRADKEIDIEIYSPPIAGFSYETIKCEQTPLQFTDESQLNSSGAIITWSWDFGDPQSGANNTSASQHPSHSYSSGGFKIVQLVVTNDNQCKDTVQHSVEIHEQPTADFSFTNFCAGDTTSFFDNSSSMSLLTNWYWDFGDPISGNNNSNDQNPTHIYSSPGPHTVTLWVTNADTCVKDTSKIITILQPPLALFSADTACLNDTTRFTDLSVFYLSQSNYWNWDFGDGVGTSDDPNPTYVYSNPGEYQVRLVVTNIYGCKDSITLTVLVRSKPIPDFTYNNFFCPAGQVNFQDLSTGVGTAITEHLWTFEPGFTSNAVNPTHVFSAYNQNFAVELIVTDNYGCQDTIVDSVFVKPAFSFTFFNDTVCFNQPTHFTTQNLAEGDSLYSISWNFGDPASGPANSSFQYYPSHLFAEPGTHVVKLKAINSDNCIDSVYKDVIVYELPDPIFTFQSEPCDSIIHFTDFSGPGSGGIASWEWDFGDGSPLLTIPAPGPGDTSHLFVDRRTYSVTLRVNNTNGCTKTVTKPVESFSCISSQFIGDSTAYCARMPVAFSDSSQPVSRINQWHWVFGDGNDTTYTQFASPIHHTFDDAGTYPVNLIITAMVNGKTFVDTAVQNITIHPTPDPLFSNKGVCMKQPTIFLDTSSTYGEAVSAWSWDFGDPVANPNDTSTFKNPTYFYDTAGYYNVKMIVQNRFGCKDSITKPTRVFGLPVAAFNTTPVCTGNPTEFLDESLQADTTLNTWQWNFGDPGTVSDSSELQNPVYTFEKEGSYPVRLRVVDYFGCSAATDSFLTAHLSPVSAFTFEPDYKNMTGQLNFESKSIGAVQYRWDFGNGQTSAEENPVMTYPLDGTYIIKLTVSNQYHCTDTTSYKYEFLFHGLYVPNAFAPESGILGVTFFKVVGINLLEFNIEVYDVQQHLIWQSGELKDNKPAEGWDGRDSKGKPMPSGTYLWKIYAKFIDGTEWRGSDSGTGNTGTIGTVTLIR